MTGAGTEKNRGGQREDEEKRECEETGGERK